MRIVSDLEKNINEAKEIFKQRLEFSKAVFTMSGLLDVFEDILRDAKEFVEQDIEVDSELKDFFILQAQAAHTEYHAFKIVFNAVKESEQ